MKKAIKIRILILLIFLICCSAFGSIFGFLKWNDYKKTINSVGYIDIALESVDKAYQLINQANLYRYLFYGFSILAGISLIALGSFLFILKSIKKKNACKNIGISQKEHEIMGVAADKLMPMEYDEGTNEAAATKESTTEVEVEESKEETIDVGQF